MKKSKTLYAEAIIYYTTESGEARISWRRGPYRTNARDTETARPAYAKQVYHHTAPAVIERKTRARFIILDPCDPRDRWILESDGSEEAARILAQCDRENTAAGRAIPRASFI